MDISEIIEILRDKRNRIEAAINVLENSIGARGRRTAEVDGARIDGPKIRNGRRGRRVSAATRKKISLAQKRRWAKQKKG